MLDRRHHNVAPFRTSDRSGDLLLVTRWRGRLCQRRGSIRPSRADHQPAALALRVLDQIRVSRSDRVFRDNSQPSLRRDLRQLSDSRHGACGKRADHDTNEDPSDPFHAVHISPSQKRRGLVTTSTVGKCRRFDFMLPIDRPRALARRPQPA